MEKCAIGTFWKSIGDAMGVPYQELLGRSQWADGLEFAEDISAWAQSYERSTMVPAATNRKTADELLPLLLFYVPKSFRPTAINFVSVMMPDILRKAMLYPSPPIHSLPKVRESSLTLPQILCTTQALLQHCIHPILPPPHYNPPPPPSTPLLLERTSNRQ